MKLRLIILCSAILLAGMGTVHAQSFSNCSPAILVFPTNGVTLIPANTCIADRNDAGRLRWSRTVNGVPNGLLELFDTDDTGTPRIWCAGQSSGTCTVGGSLCMNSNGVLQMYSDSTCGQNGGSVIFTAGLSGDNVCGEGVLVSDDSTGEHIVVQNGLFCGTRNVLFKEGSD